MSANAVRAALNISYVAVVWSIVAGTLSVVIGVRSSSTALLGTGADVLADMISSVVLVWRFRAEHHGGHPGSAAERRAHLVASTALLLVGFGIGAASVARLASGEGASPQTAAVVAAAASVVVLPGLAIVKLRIAAAVPSPALRTDALITIVGASTAAVTLIGLLLTRALHWTAADPVAALVIAALAIATGIRKLQSRN